MQESGYQLDAALTGGGRGNIVTWISNFSAAGFKRGGVNAVRDTAWFARTWADALAATGCAAAGEPEIETSLRLLSKKLCVALWSTPFSVDAACEVGASLASGSLAGESVLETSVGLIGRLLPMLDREATEFRLADHDNGHDVTDIVDDQIPDLDVTARVSLLQGAIADGYVRAFHTSPSSNGDRQLRRKPARSAPSISSGSSNEWFGTVFNSAGIGMSVALLDGRFIDVNQATVDLLGYDRESLREMRWDQLLEGETAPEALMAYQALIQGETRYMQMEQRYRRKDGELIWTNLTVSLIRDAAGAPLYTVAMAEDITERRHFQQNLRHQATHDHLTDLPNRTLFFERLDEVLERNADRPRARVGICYLDLDRFKAVNDTLGHAVGDQLLVAVAARLKRCVSAHGRMIARIGGDEFVILVDDSGGLDDVVATAEAALQALESPIEAAGSSFSISASVGVVERSVANTSAKELMAAADMTLYWAKEEGRGRYAVFDADRNAREATRLGLFAALPDALKREEFLIEYQPLVSLAERKLIGVEALVRWRHPQFGVVPPGDFISLAEETGAIIPLGRWVLAQACQQAATWAQQFPYAGRGNGLHVSVNVASRQIRDSAIVDDVEELLARTGLSASLLQLELTENEIMATAGRPLRVLEELAAMGVRIAIDDFGTGYSNLAYLKRLPADTIKLDRSFVRDLGGVASGPSVDESIISTLVSLAHTLGMTVTAEGVENAIEADILRELGCDSGQGWLFGRPCPAEKITGILAATETQHGS